jgi:hypothetical protein
MKKYLNYIAWCFVPKNKLDDAITSYFKNIDRKIINEELLEEHKNNILNDVAKLNAEYPRCTPKEVKFRSIHFSEDIALDGLPVIEFKLLAGNEIKVKP